MSTPAKTILVWLFADASEELKELSKDAENATWVALVPANYPYTVAWAEGHECYGFGNDVQTIKLDDGRTVYIGHYS